jgi:hypothetical protein
MASRLVLNMLRRSKCLDLHVPKLMRICTRRVAHALACCKLSSMHVSVVELHHSGRTCQVMPSTSVDLGICSTLRTQLACQSCTSLQSGLGRIAQRAEGQAICQGISFQGNSPFSDRQYHSGQEIALISCLYSVCSVSRCIHEASSL